MVRRGDELEVFIDDVRFPNTGVVNHKDTEIRLKGELKGTKGLIRIQKKRRNYAQGKLVETIEKSVLDTKEGCPHFGKCGGCSYQNMSYKDELLYKEEQIRRLFERQDIDIDIGKIKPSPIIEGYRNKMDYTFGDEYKDGPLALGMHRRGAFYEIESVEYCNIADDDFRKILISSLKHFQESGLDFYHKRRHEGALRNLIVRKAKTTDQILVNLVTSSQREIDTKAFVDMLLGLELDADIVGVFHTINDGVADFIRPEEMYKLYGEDYITEEICGLSFQISPFSFFQTNTLAAEELYKMAQEFIGDIKDQTVFDLYSGTGTIGQIMAQIADRVVAVEIVEEAVEMARKNAELNGLENIEFYQGDVYQIVDKLDINPDLIVIDPPRPGIEKGIEKLIEFNPDTFIYISCNPITFVRDLKILEKNGYELEKINMMDQFPRTPHIELVSRIIKKK